MNTSRAAEVLEGLLGRTDDDDLPNQRRTLFERGTGEHAGWRSRQGAPRVGWLGIVAALAVVGVIAYFGWDFVVRPVPVEEGIPLSASAPKSSAPSSTAPPTTPSKVFVHVAGAVQAPGVVELPGDSRAVDAVAAAGGLRSDADPDRVNLAAPLVDGSRVVVPAVGQPPPGEVPIQLPQGTAGQLPLVDLNTATADELEGLPGVGPATAAAIITQREKGGRFRSVDSLLDVRGIGDSKLEAIRDLVTVSGT